MKPLVVVLAVAGSAGLGWYVYRDSSHQAAQSTGASGKEKIAVQVTRVRTCTIEERADLVGSLTANATVTIRAKTPGYIVGLPYDVGDVVEAGKPVVELDKSQHQELVSRADAALKVAQSQLRAQETRAVQAKKELERQELLARSRATSTEQREAAAAQLAIAAAQVELEQARVAQAESDLLRAKLSHDETRIVSPIRGYVAARPANPGDLADSTTDLLTIVDLEKVRTVVHIVEKDYEKVKLGQSASIRVDAFPEAVFTGEVIRKSPVMDEHTRTAAVQIEIPNPNVLLKPGMHARVTITFDVHKDAEVIPVASLIEHRDRPALYVVEGDPPTTVLHEVKTGLTDGDMVEILSGVNGNDRVVTLGARLVQHGQEVTAVEAPSAVLLDRATSHGAE